MMNAKTTTVTLEAHGVTREFEFAHAERILQMRDNGGWVLADKKYEFVNNALRLVIHKKGDSGK